MQPELTSFIQEALGIKGASIKERVNLPGGATADAIIKTPSTLYVVEVKSGLPRQDAVAQLAFVAKLAQKAYPGLTVTPLLVVRNAPESVRASLKEIEGILVEVPPQLLPQSDRPKGLVPLTTERAWRVVTSLLRQRVAKSVRALATSSGVSIGWVYQVVSELKTRGIVETNGGLRLTDPAKLLDIVPSERPFEKLRFGTVQSAYTDAREAAVELTRLLSKPPGRKNPFAFAFGGWTAAGLYTGYAHRHDVLDLYAVSNDIQPYIGEKGGGIPVRLYSPDRPLLEEAQKVEKVRVVSRDVALLDIAGMGFSAHDLAMILLQTYGARERD